MFFIRSESSFDSAHFLKDYKGKCHNLHGHRWKTMVEVKGEKLKEDEQTRGMLHDFGNLKKDLKAMCDHFDHSMIYEKDSLKPATLKALQDENFRLIEVPFRPTAEEFSRYFYEEFQKKGYDVHRVEVFETPNNCASYEE